MIDLAQTEVAALLELIAWEREDGNALSQSPTRDAELKSAARKLARPAPASSKVDAARASRNNALEERNMLLAWLTRQLEIGQSHLAPTLNADTLFPWVVCIHVKSGPLAWRISDGEAVAYFGHLKRHDCGLHTAKRDDKLARLAALVTAER